MTSDFVWCAILVAVLFVALWRIHVLEDALMRIGHYHGDSVGDIKRIAYEARGGYRL